MSEQQHDKDEASQPRPGDEIAPSRYRKLPVEIEAIRWCGTNLKAVIDFTGRHPSADEWTWAQFEEVVRTKGLKIFTLEGHHMASVGDYIIKGVHGEFYPCKPDIFWKTYERATAPLPETGTPSDAEARVEAVLAAAERVSHLPSELCDFIREQARELASKTRDADHFFQLSGRYLEELNAARSAGGLSTEDAARLEAMTKATYSHVDGRDLLHQLQPNGAHHIDIVVRINGEDRRYEGDWLKTLTHARDGHNMGEYADNPKLRAMIEAARTDAAPGAQQEPSGVQSTTQPLKAEKDEAYRQRNVLVAALARMYPSGIRRTEITGWSDDWHGCCFIDLPSGQISYHYHDSQAHLFEGLPPYTKEWDGHDKKTVEDRLLTITAVSATGRGTDG